jgi:hypothetical protein
MSLFNEDVAARESEALAAAAKARKLEPTTAGPVDYSETMSLDLRNPSKEAAFMVLAFIEEAREEARRNESVRKGSPLQRGAREAAPIVRKYGKSPELFGRGRPATGRVVDRRGDRYEVVAQDGTPVGSYATGRNGRRVAAYKAPQNKPVKRNPLPAGISTPPAP